MDTVDAEHVGDLVRVGDDRCRAERQYEAGQLVDEKLHRLDVHVRVDEAGNDVLPGGVDRLPALVRTKTCDRAVGDRHVALEPLAREHRQDEAARDDEVGGLVPAGDGNRSFQTGHRGDDNA